MSTLTRSTVLAAAITSALYGTAFAAPADSAYVTDVQNTYVEDATSRGIGQVNMITCFIASMEPDQLVNDGNYIALVDESKCDSEGRSDSGNAGSSSGASQAASYTTATVASTRTSNEDPMLVNVWVDQNEEGMSGTIYVHGSFVEAPSDLNPYGVFRLDFCGAFDGAGCMMRGFIDATDGELNFYSDEGDGEFASSVALRLTSVGTASGSGEMRMSRSEGEQSQTQEFLFAYNESHFLRGDQCFSRDASDPETGMSVWRYGLYDETTGERVERNSGFPIEYTVDGHTYHGHLGYWGLSLPPDVVNSLPDGATVQKVDYSAGEEPTRTDYTLLRAGGKLNKYTKEDRTLQSIDKIRFNTFLGEVNGLFDGATPNTQYIMYWDDANSVIQITGKMSCGDNGCTNQDFDTPHAVSLDYWAGWNGIMGWSEALGGELFIDLSDESATTSAQIDVVYRKQELVYPNEMPANLYCLSNCPTAASIAGYFGGGGTPSPYSDNTFNNWQPTNTPVSYTSDITAGLLKDAQNEAVVFTDAEAAQSHPEYQHGIRTGRLFTDLEGAECMPDSGTYCEHKVNTLDVYYVWETGPNSWNQFAAVKDDDGEYVTFEAPLQVTFDVPNDAVVYKEYAGKSIVLQYGGFGDLWGIPGSCVSHLTNEPVSCDTEGSRYVPEFVIPYDETTGRVTLNEQTYLVKWLEREIRFARKDLAECAALTLPADTTLPSADQVQDPSDPASPIYIGTKPTVVDPPRVVHGDVKF